MGAKSWPLDMHTESGVQMPTEGGSVEGEATEMCAYLPVLAVSHLSKMKSERETDSEKRCKEERKWTKKAKD